jgi:hypothetical protein
LTDDDDARDPGDGVSRQIAPELCGQPAKSAVVSADPPSPARAYRERKAPREDGHDGQLLSTEIQFLQTR